MCDCRDPIRVRTAIVYLRRRRKKNGCWTADIHFDCLLCGPYTVRANFHIAPPAGTLTVVAEPAHWRGERSGLVGLMKRREQGLLRGKEER